MCPDATRTRDTICAFPNCTSQVWQDPDGSFSSYCGTTHRDAAIALARPPALCKNCQQSPVYVQDGKAHDYCGKRCAADARTKSPSSDRRLSSTPSVIPKCCIPGCTRPVFVGADGSASQWCSQRHRSQDKKTEACLLCKRLPKAMLKTGLSEYCSRKCGQAALSLAPTILSINNNYETFKEVSQQFIDQWKHPTRIPNVVKVWRIMGLKTLHNDFSRYKLAVERNRSLAGGNSKRRWHGTVRACKLGDDEGQKKLCSNPGCSLCNIIETSFRVAQSGQQTNYGRFGKGIYTSATSSKANDYVREPGMSPYKAMLLNDVVLGNAKKLYVDQPHLTRPPAGYDSVIGEPGHSLNYDEAIVYKNEAIRPLFLVIYQ